MDPSLQEFYCISRSASQQRPFSEIITTSQRPISRASSRHPPTANVRERPASSNVYAWSSYHPLTVPSIAQISIQQPLSPTNVQDAFSNETGGRRRHHTAGYTDRLNQGIGAASPNAYDDDPHSDPLQSYRQSQSSHRSSSPCSNSRYNDPYTQDDDDASANPDFPRMDQLDDLDDFERYISGQEADPHRDFGITENEDEIGFFCGLIASSFFFAQFCTSIFWGYMSDRYGRRPILLLGLIGSTIASLFFGLSKSLAWAIVSRSMCGLLNGNVGVAKSMLGEIADPSNQSQAFSIFGFAWGIGM
ncbi:hypothetical protein CPC16_004053, partial [Podila verticillata]